MAYHTALIDAGGQSELHVIDGLVHDGMRALGVPEVEETYKCLAEWLAQRV